MKILHCCLSNFYIDDFGYQENYLPMFNQQDRHDVRIIASTETYINSELNYVKPSRYKTETGIPIIRIDYTRLLPHFISRKTRIYPKFYEELNLISPDVILFHGTCAYAIKVAAKYVKKNPRVKLYVDCHEAYYNSAQGIVSKYILHKLLYRTWFHRALPYISKVLYIGEGEKEYLKDMMGLYEDKMEFYPLGGVIVPEAVKKQKKLEIRKELGLSEDQVMLLHSGKLDRLKRTEDLLNAFSSVSNSQLKLFIIGSIPENQESALLPLIEEDSRIIFLGWKSADELSDYLTASDIYLQPGSVSATLQNAICSGTPVMIYPHSSYDVYVQENGFKVVSEDDMIEVFRILADDPSCLKEMSTASYRYAREYLDYRKLAARLYR